MTKHCSKTRCICNECRAFYRGYEDGVSEAEFAFRSTTEKARRRAELLEEVCRIADLAYAAPETPKGALHLKITEELAGDIPFCRIADLAYAAPETPKGALHLKITEELAGDIPF